ncbi:MAG TPA: hypothetical protein VGX71_13610 [Pseudaminobacter sp.]|nr:hypothetical protein [Pseudaminobacter sp.]
MKTNVALLAMNRGLVSSTALARIDVDRIRLSAETMTNWLPKTQGAMFLRPGFGYIGTAKNNAFGIDIPFVAATDDTARLELADGVMRVWVNDTLVTRVAVTTSISALTSSTNWTDQSTNGGTVAHGGGGLTLDANNVGGEAKVQQTVTCSGSNIGKRHAIAVNVTRGPVTFRVGSTSGGDEYIAETTLRTGVHSLALTPTGNFYVQFQSDRDVNRIVASCAIAAAGTMELTIPWTAADLPFVRYSQSADVVFVACDGHQQRRIERRATDSWSLVRYAPDTGPFFAARTARVQLKVAETHGNTTLTADKPFFKSTHVGALFTLFNGGYAGTFNLAGEGSFTDPIRVAGVKEVDGDNFNDRAFKAVISGTWAGTLRLQRSFDEPDSGYADYRKSSADTTTDITINGAYSNHDSSDNAIIYYRMGFKPGDYTSGAASVQLIYAGGGVKGVCRVTGFTSSTQVSVEVLKPFSGTEYTDDWQEGIWSDRQGWPSSGVLHKGRLWWLGKSRFIGSISDDYENFDPDFEGDGGPINRTLGAGPVDTINFTLSLGRLIVGTSGSEYSVKSTSFDEPLTPQNAQAGDPSTQGSRQGCDAAKVDNRGIFAQRSGKRLFELIFDPDTYEYAPRDLTLLAPDLTGSAKVVGMAVQRQPDTRIHVWLDDGSVVLLTYEPAEEVTCWSRIAPGGSGFVERVTVLPGEDEDLVYYRVKRTINGGTVRYSEKMALESECVGGTMNKQGDSFVIVEAVTGTSVTGLSHLEGKEVVTWGGGADLGTYTVSGGAITLDAAVTATDVMVGLGYDALYKSTKLAYAAAAGTALNQLKRVNYLGCILRNTHNDGLYFGRDFDNMDPLPRLIDGRPVTTTEVFPEFDKPAFLFPGEWDTDSRLYLKASAPKPCEIMAAVLSVEAHDKV